MGTDGFRMALADILRRGINCALKSMRGRVSQAPGIFQAFQPNGGRRAICQDDIRRKQVISRHAINN